MEKILFISTSPLRPPEVHIKKVTGLLDLIQTAVDKGTTAIEEIHAKRIVTNFAVVQKIPALGRLSEKARDIQLHHTGRIYAIIRLVNQECGNFAKLIVAGADKLTGASPSMALRSGQLQETDHGIIKGHRKYTEFFVSIVNGIIGDLLQKNSNGLALAMGFYTHGRRLLMTREAIEMVYPKATSKLCIMVHGLICNEKTWEFHADPAMNYGSLLEKDLGYTPFYVRYNTGLPISENGRNFSALMSDLLQAYPKEVEEILLIGHSMGGLVIRSACWYGQKEQMGWVRHVKKIIYLASPHLGAPLEKFGKVLCGVLIKMPSAYPKLIADIINLRSSGIKDLRFGKIIDENRDGHDPAIVLGNNAYSIPLMEGAAHYAVSGSITGDPSDCFTQYIGDPMVPKASALGRSRFKERSMGFREYREFSKVGHIRLAHCHRVYQAIKMWCRQAV